MSPKKQFEVIYVADSAVADAFLRANASEIQALTTSSRCSRRFRGARGRALTHFEAKLRIAAPLLEFRINLAGLVDAAEEMKRVRKEMEKVQADLDFVRNKLGKVVRRQGAA